MGRGVMTGVIIAAAAAWSAVLFAAGFVLGTRAVKPPVPERHAPTPQPPNPLRPAPAPGPGDVLECVVYHYASGRREYYAPDGFPIAILHRPPAPQRPDKWDLWYRGVCAEAKREDQ
jgi:hypothetical protein